MLSDIDQQRLEDAYMWLKAESVFVAADMTRQDQVERVVEAGQAKFGHVDIVVHTAGVTGAKGDPLELSDEDYLEAWNTDFFSAVRVARATIPLRLHHLRKRCAAVLGGSGI